MNIILTAKDTGGFKAPLQTYFARLQEIAARACLDTDSADSALALCDYLDAVDGGDIQMDKTLYQGSVASLAHWMMDNPVQAKKLSQKSWAASTLVALLKEELEELDG